MLTENQLAKIEQVSIGLIDTPRTIDFNCLDFVRLVYESVDLTAPRPSNNVKLSELRDPPVGYVLYLLHKEHHRGRRWSHVAILLTGRRVIHCSRFFGGKVVITPLDIILEHYTVV